MNAVSFPVARAATQEYFTAREMAELAARLGYRGLPHTESAVIRRAKRDGWADRFGGSSRKRAGQAGGGGLEYHISLVPDLQELLTAEHRLETNRDGLNALPVVSAQAPAAPDTPVQAPTDRDVAAMMHARAEIVVASALFA